VQYPGHLDETGEPREIRVPDSGITKADPARHRADVADRMVPSVAGRPVNMQRFPDGIEGSSFDEKKVPWHFPDAPPTNPFVGAVLGNRSHMGALLIPIIAVAVIVVFAFVAGRRWLGQRQRVADDLAAPSTATIDYRVPPGQDPVVLLTALSAEGFTATTSPADATLIRVACPAGPDRYRAQVRAVIASVDTTAIDSGATFDVEDVRFTDEQGNR
jgi:hypothetical protein